MLKVLDLFSGIGGFSLGFGAAGGFETVAFCEVEPFCRSVLERHWPGVPIHDDIRSFSGASLRGVVDVVVGGFPCQQVSCAGNGEGLGTEEAPTERSGLWYEMLRVIREVRPRWCVIENVPALRTKGIDDVLAGLERAGYSARSVVVPACVFAAGHERYRCWIVADLAVCGLGSGSGLRGDGEPRRRWELDGVGAVIDDAGCQGLQGHAGNGDGTQGRQAPDRHAAPADILRGPATFANTVYGPQHPWEPPRLNAKGTRLNPDWCEAYMGYPVGWTAPGKDKQRIHALGNAVVPHIPAAIAGWILEMEQPEQQDSPVTEPLPTFIGFDTETFPLAGQNLCPKIVCASLAVGYKEDPAHDTPCELVGNGDPEGALEATVRDLFTGSGKDSIKVAHKSAFDLAVVAANWPDMMTTIWQQLEEGKIECTIIREKLLNLAESGRLQFIDDAEGVPHRADYSLAGLVKKYYGVKLEGKDDDDAWRTNYRMLDGIPTAEWPADAARYALDDAVWVLAVHHCQEKRRQALKTHLGIDPLASLGFQVMKDFALYLVSAWGTAVDPEAKARMEKEVRDAAGDDKMLALLRSGVLRPGTPSRPHAGGAKEHVDGCTNKSGCNCPPKMTEERPASINKAKLKEYVLAMVAEKAAKGIDIPLRYTEPSKTFPEGQLSIDAEWLEDNKGLDPVVDELHLRQSLQKIVTTELPRMNDRETGTTAAIVHPCYDVLKETGRTSSYGSDKYPSFNGQNVDPRARGCYVPRPGNLMGSVDYSGMELGTAAQTCLNLFGFSVMADKINAGIDVHAYLGAQLAYRLHPEFHKVCGVESVDSADRIYEAFTACKKSEDEAKHKFYSHWRKFAKPTNLGYPGGLGAQTFVGYAKATYGVTVSLDEAKALKAVWLETFPEFVMFFDWINHQCIDPWHREAYAYSSPLGMYRSNASYCAAANGKALQTPSAEGATLAIANVVRACYDGAMSSILFDDAQGPTCRVINFVHDEIIVEVRDDNRAHDRMYEVSRIMVEAMRVVTPDVKVTAQPVLMRRWNKDASPMFGEDGRLKVWEPSAE